MAVGHLGTIMFKSGGKRKHHHLAATAAQVEAGTEFWAQDQVLENLDTFKYLERKISFDKSDWPVVDRNLQRERSKWGQLFCLLCQNWG